MPVFDVPFVPCPKDGNKGRNMFVEIKSKSKQISTNENVIETLED
jgi:hypothetical protein